VTDSTSYERGVVAGEISARLLEHDRHFEKINGSMERVADELHDLTLAMQRLGDAAASDRATVITTAAALKSAEEARRDQGEQRWSPLTRLAVIAGTLAALGTVAGLIVANVH
jgi:hypothetical protein